MTESMQTVLTRAKAGKMFQMTNADTAFPDALEAAQRGWVELSKSGVVYAPGGVPCALLILGLTAEGHAALDAAAAEAEARTPKARAKRLGAAVAGRAWRWFDFFVGAIVGAIGKSVFDWLIGLIR